jgi:hypothetical protein
MTEDDKKKLVAAKAKIAEARGDITSIQENQVEDSNVANGLGEIVDDIENIETAIDELDTDDDAVE